jgi:hypothetical protein
MKQQEARMRSSSSSRRLRERSPGWVTSSAAAGALVTLGACAQGTTSGTLVGDYVVRGVLVQNGCGADALPTPSPLDYNLEIREDTGVGYWAPSKQTQITGSLNAQGQFSFSVSQSTVLSQTQAGQNLQPNNFMTQQPDFDLQTKTCAVTSVHTITGSLRRRNAADGGGVAQLGPADAGTEADLTADDVVDVSPSAGSDCNSSLMALGGTYLSLPCTVHYVLTGTLSVQKPLQQSASPQTAATSGGTATVSSATAGTSPAPAKP